MCMRESRYAHEKQCLYPFFNVLSCSVWTFFFYDSVLYTWYLYTYRTCEFIFRCDHLLFTPCAFTWSHMKRLSPLELGCIEAGKLLYTFLKLMANIRFISLDVQPTKSDCFVKTDGSLDEPVSDENKREAPVESCRRSPNWCIGRRPRTAFSSLQVAF